jgi:hypothetical protein
MPKELAGLQLKVRVRYHIQTEPQHQMLIQKFGLTADDQYHFAVYERNVPLAGDLAVQFEEPAPVSQLACAAPHAG